VKLDDKQYEKLLEHLRGQWKTPYKCPVCGNNNWNISQEVFELRGFNKGGLVVGGGSPVFPVVPVVCLVCGHVIFFNALAAGVDLEDNPHE